MAGHHFHYLIPLSCREDVVSLPVDGIRIRRRHLEFSDQVDAVDKWNPSVSKSVRD